MTTISRYIWYRAHWSELSVAVMEANVVKADDRKQARIDPAWPETAPGQLGVSEFTASLQAALSPFGDTTFPLDKIPYEHPETEINKSP